MRMRRRQGMETEAEEPLGTGDLQQAARLQQLRQRRGWQLGVQKSCKPAVPMLLRTGHKHRQCGPNATEFCLPWCDQ